ncbi:MAG: outer membrane protein assembly factor BamA [Azospirillum sp.]|nr:outer membrane protein assembly factor BamA [Azospirillum sp.]
MVANAVMTGGAGAQVPAPVAAAARPVQSAQAFAGGTIRDIRVDGVQRIEPVTVRSYMVVTPGDPFDPERIDQSLKALFNTGLFADVTLRREGDVLVVKVVENPIINRIAFEGNSRIKEDQLKTEVQLRPRVVFTRTRVQSDVQRILDIYRRNGRFAATVEPKVIQLDQNRVDLVFEISEGPRTGVSRINFVGNEQFSDGDLRSQIQTKESRWYRFLSSDDNYDPDRLNYDKELLRRFYLAEGYADFRVVSAIAELTPDKEDFFITFTLEEGERYKFGKIDLVSTLKGLDIEALREQVTTKDGDWYDGNEIETTKLNLVNALGDLQYAFVDIRPRIQRNREALTIELTYEINEGPRVFVERIDVTGNVRTIDKVIRREILLAEGDPFNATKLQRSEQRIKDLNFFEKVNVNTVEGSRPDQSVVQVDVVEQSTGEISLGAGYSTTDGPLADFSIRERNLLGRGQDLRVGATISGIRQEYDLSFTEPYFLDHDLSAGFDLFRITRDLQTYSGYNEQSTGMGLRLGYPLTERLRQRLTYGFSHNSIDDVDDGASTFIKEQEGSRNLSVVGQELLYDARNSKSTPTRGYYVRFNTDVAGLGGNAKFVRGRLGSGFYYPIVAKWILNVSGEVGAIVGLGQDVNIADRYFIGGDTLRGFRTAGIGPRDVATGDALGGKNFQRASVELSFPVGLPEEFGLSGHLFSDAGTLTGLDRTGPTVQDTGSLRLASGVGVGWKSPFGPIRVDLAIPILKEEFDKKEEFRFSFGTRF